MYRRSASLSHMDNGGTLDAFLAAVAPEVRESWADSADGGIVLEALSRAETQSGLALPRLDFAAYLGERVRSAQDLGRMELGDLHLAFGCVCKDNRALSRFQACHGALFEVSEGQVDPRELRSDLMAFVLEPRANRGPRLADYGGRGKLRSWLEVTIGRRLIDLRRAARRSDKDRVGLDETTAGLELHPELAYLKSSYRDATENALREALQELDARARNILRQHYAHGLSTRELAALYGQHRSTINRRLTDAREHLFEQVRSKLSRALALPASELDSILRWVGQSLHVTADRFWDGASTE